MITGQLFRHNVGFTEELVTRGYNKNGNRYDKIEISRVFKGDIIDLLEFSPGESDKHDNFFFISNGSYSAGSNRDVDCIVIGSTFNYYATFDAATNTGTNAKGWHGIWLDNGSLSDKALWNHILYLKKKQSEETNIENIAPQDPDLKGGIDKGYFTDQIVKIFLEDEEEPKKKLYYLANLLYYLSHVTTEGCKALTYPEEAKKFLLRVFPYCLCLVDHRFFVDKTISNFYPKDMDISELKGTYNFVMASSSNENARLLESDIMKLNAANITKVAKKRWGDTGVNYLVPLVDRSLEALENEGAEKFKTVLGDQVKNYISTWKIPDILVDEPELEITPAPVKVKPKPRERTPVKIDNVPVATPQKEKPKRNGRKVSYKPPVKEKPPERSPTTGQRSNISPEKAKKYADYLNTFKKVYIDTKTGANK